MTRRVPDAPSAATRRKQRDRRAPSPCWQLGKRRAPGSAIGPSPPKRLARGRRVLAHEANAFAVNIMPVIDALRQSGVTDLRSIASALNARAVRTACGGRWHVSNVKNLLDRARPIPFIGGKIGVLNANSCFADNKKVYRHGGIWAPILMCQYCRRTLGVPHSPRGSGIMLAKKRAVLSVLTATTLSDKLMEMSVGIADQRIPI